MSGGKWNVLKDGEWRDCQIDNSLKVVPAGTSTRERERDLASFHICTTATEIDAFLFKATLYKKRKKKILAVTKGRRTLEGDGEEILLVDLEKTKKLEYNQRSFGNGGCKNSRTSGKRGIFTHTSCSGGTTDMRKSIVNIFMY